ncbi:MAG TPA: M23 family metallopeptidase, partial [Phenylobacterium sp.]|nr:M23 family metallopeptidase [Phenylobacterium sp.]
TSAAPSPTAPTRSRPTPRAGPRRGACCADPGREPALVAGRLRSTLWDDDRWALDEQAQREGFAVLADLPATTDVVSREHSPIWRVPLGADASKQILDFWRETRSDGTLRWPLTDPALDTRFLGDIYQDLSEAAKKLPFARPTNHTGQSSGFGVRFDPFTRRPAFHSGLDFVGGFGVPIYSTAPGVVSFTGVRSGYGNTIEIDHGRGFKTRYAHLQGIGVRAGQRVAVGQRIGAMGSTGRSTGPHLHYEVWVNGRAQNPDRFVKAGDYVQQAS